MSYPDITQQTIGEPLSNPWYIPGFTSQHPIYQVIPKTPFSIPGFPSPPAAVYVTVTANYFDEDGNPIGGYLTFYPSSALTFTLNSVTTVVPQRFTGQNLWDTSGNFWGSGKVYLRNGNLQVSLLATDNAGISMVPSSFTYRVTENFLGGRTYDISVPSTSVSPVDINSLIISGGFNVGNNTPISQNFTSQSVWLMTYTFPYMPVVITTDASGNIIIGQVDYNPGLLSGTVTVTFGSPQTGTMELR